MNQTAASAFAKYPRLPVNARSRLARARPSNTKRATSTPFGTTARRSPPPMACRSGSDTTTPWPALREQLSLGAPEAARLQAPEGPPRRAIRLPPPGDVERQRVNEVDDAGQR